MAPDPNANQQTQPDPLQELVVRLGIDALSVPVAPHSTEIKKLAVLEGIVFDLARARIAMTVIAEIHKYYVAEPHGHSTVTSIKGAGTFVTQVLFDSPEIQANRQKDFDEILQDLKDFEEFGWGIIASTGLKPAPPAAVRERIEGLLPTLLTTGTREEVLVVLALAVKSAKSFKSPIQNLFKHIERSSLNLESGDLNFYVMNLRRAFNSDIGYGCSVSDGEFFLGRLTESK